MYPHPLPARTITGKHEDVCPVILPTEKSQVTGLQLGCRDSIAIIPLFPVCTVQAHAHSGLIDPICEPGTIQAKRLNGTAGVVACGRYQPRGIPRVVPASF